MNRTAHLLAFRKKGHKPRAMASPNVEGRKSPRVNAKPRPRFLALRECPGSVHCREKGLGEAETAAPLIPSSNWSAVQSA